MLRHLPTPTHLPTISPRCEIIIAEIKAASLSQLRIGELLAAAREKFKAARKSKAFRQFIVTIPGLTVPTAYRHMSRWRVAEKSLPAPVRAYALVAGVDLAGTSDTAPYGKFTDAVREVGAPPAVTGDKRRDDEAAQQYVHLVSAARTKLQGRATRKTETFAGLVKHGVDQLTRLTLRVPERDREKYLREVVQGVLRKPGAVLKRAA
jgi:hypothetical protein